MKIDATVAVLPGCVLKFQVGQVSVYLHKTNVH